MEEWQRHFVEAVIQHHNSTYVTHITLKGRCESFYPALRGDQRWDWVCEDNTSGKEIAVEVKKLMNKKLKERDSIAYREIYIPLQNMLNGKLPGTFRLILHIKEGDLPLNANQKTKLINDLEREIIEVAPGLKLKESYQLAEKFTTELRTGLSVSLTKVKDSNSKLVPSLNFAWWGNNLLRGNELHVNFKKLVQNANRQLGIAREKGINSTFFIVIMDEYGDSSIQELQDVLHDLAPTDYSNIDFCYLHNCWEGCQPALLKDWSG